LRLHREGAAFNKLVRLGVMFTFEHTYQFSETEYVVLWSPLNQQSATARVWGATTVARVKRFSIVAIGLIMLLWPCTVGLGLAVLAISMLVMFAPHLVHGISARTFRQLRYLEEPLAYGANNDRVWVRGSDFTVEASRRYLTVWREQGAGPMSLDRVRMPRHVQLTGGMWRHEAAGGVNDDCLQLHAIDGSGAAWSGRTNR
jgi:hypothetical protein